MKTDAIEGVAPPNNDRLIWTLMTCDYKWDNRRVEKTKKHWPFVFVYTTGRGFDPLSKMSNRKLAKFLIVLDNESLLYFPGSFLTGQVIVELDDDTPVQGTNLANAYAYERKWTVWRSEGMQIISRGGDTLIARFRRTLDHYKSYTHNIELKTFESIRNLASSSSHALKLNLLPYRMQEYLQRIRKIYGKSSTIQNYALYPVDCGQ